MPKPMIVSSRPCDVNYRLKRAHEHLTQAIEFLAAVDPSTLPEGFHAAILESAQRTAMSTHDARMVTAAPKRGRKEPTEAVELSEPEASDEPADPSEKYDGYDVE